MSDAFADALDKIRGRSKGWSSPDNLSNLTHPDKDDLQAFSTAWAGLDDDTRYRIASRLADLSGDPALSFEAAFELLLDDELARVRAIAISGLEDVMDGELARRILWLLQNDPDADVRAEAATALGSFLSVSDSDEGENELERSIEDALLETINSATEDVLVRQRAVEAYAFASDPYVDDVLQEAYDSDQDEIRASAIFAMGRRGDEDWLPLVHRELRNEAENIRMAAIYAASEIASSSSVPLLLQVIGEDPSDDVRIAAVYALADIETPEAGRILEDLLDSSDAAISSAADDALEMRQESEAFDDMLLYDYDLSDDELARGDGNLENDEGSDG